MSMMEFHESIASKGDGKIAAVDPLIVNDNDTYFTYMGNLLAIFKDCHSSGSIGHSSVTSSLSSSPTTTVTTPCK